MRFMPIIPIGMDRLFASSKIRDAFILPQFWTNDSYRNMYTRRRWDTAIIDNAMYENPNPVAFDKLIEISKEIHSDRTFIVAPEDHADPVHTAQLLCDTMEEFGSYGPTWGIMMIVHGSPLEIDEMMSMLPETQSIGFGIAVSTWRNGFSRAAIKHACGDSCYFHAMGLDSISEMEGLSLAGFNSVDSSMAATAAVNHIPLTKNTVIRRVEGHPYPTRVPLLQDTFMIEDFEQTEKNVSAMISWLR